jgi:hypothetical protein
MSAMLLFEAPSAGAYWTNEYQCTTSYPNGNHCYIIRIAQVNDSNQPIGNKITNTTAWLYMDCQETTSYLDADKNGSTVNLVVKTPNGALANLSQPEWVEAGITTAVSKTQAIPGYTMDGIGRGTIGMACLPGPVERTSTRNLR